MCSTEMALVYLGVISQLLMWNETPGSGGELQGGRSGDGVLGMGMGVLGWNLELEMGVFGMGSVSQLRNLLFFPLHPCPTLRS